LKNKHKYFWTCDSSSRTGEGRLASLFINDLKKNFKLTKIKIPNSKIKLLDKILRYKYVIPFIGIFYCWKSFLNNHKVYYINYLPFWNFLIFALLPPNTNIGPITGGARYNENTNIIRKIVFPICYFLSEIIVNLRNFNLIFSTDLLKKNLSKRTIKKSEFHYILKKFNHIKKKRVKKNIDFLIYFRENDNKKINFPYTFIKKLSSKGFSVYIVGDKLDIPKVINHGKISNLKVSKLQSKAKFTIFSHENIYSLFTLECITNNVNVLIDKTYNDKINYFKKNFIRIDFNSFKEFNRLKK